MTPYQPTPSDTLLIRIERDESSVISRVEFYQGGRVPFIATRTVYGHGWLLRGSDNRTWTIQTDVQLSGLIERGGRFGTLDQLAAHMGKSDEAKRAEMDLLEAAARDQAEERREDHDEACRKYQEDHADSEYDR